MAASSWWVIIIWFFLTSFDSPSSQVSDGQYLTYNVALHPHCSVTFNKNTWKGQNGKRSPEDIISSYRFPTIKVLDKSVEVALCTFLLKVIDLVRKEGDHTTVLFLSKVWNNAEEKF